MIGFLTGVIKLKTVADLILMTSGGVGYRVLMAGSDLAELSEGDALELWVHTSVREDAITLFGFLRQESYDLFQLLLTVKGVGPKIALGILGSTAPENFVAAVQKQDLHYMTQLPGIGKKGAERLLLELKDKVLELGFAAGGVDNAQGKKATAAPVVAGSREVDEAVEALVALGYSKNEVMNVIREMDNLEGLSGEQILRLALKQFARR